MLAEFLKQHGYKQIDFGKEGALDKLYAVLPVGVETIIPSATADVRKRPPM